MAKIIAVTNQKGGVGKTTTCVNLAAALAEARRRVLLIDFDPQGHATMGSGIPKKESKPSGCEVLLHEVPIEQALRHVEAGYDLLPGNGDLTAAEVRLMPAPGREMRLKQLLAPIRSKYHYVLIDCPPSLGVLTLNALTAADSVLIPIQCEFYALDGLTALLDTIKAVKASVNPALQIEGLLRTMFDVRNNLGNEVSGQLLKHFGDKVFRTIVPRNVRVAEAPSHGQPITQYDRDSRGAVAYLGLAGEILRHEREQAAQRAGTQG
ncbi:MAG: ParA family protein [Lysobacterales bacterium]